MLLEKLRRALCLQPLGAPPAEAGHAPPQLRLADRENGAATDAAHRGAGFEITPGSATKASSQEQASPLHHEPQGLFRPSAPCADAPSNTQQPAADSPHDERGAHGSSSSSSAVQQQASQPMQVERCPHCQGLAFNAMHRGGVQRWLERGALGVLSVILQPGAEAGSLWAMPADSLGNGCILGGQQAVQSARAIRSPYLACHGLEGLQNMCTCQTDPKGERSARPMPEAAVCQSLSLSSGSSGDEAPGEDACKLSAVLATLEEWSHTQDQRAQQPLAQAQAQQALPPLPPAQQPTQQPLRMAGPSLDLARGLQAAASSSGQHAHLPLDANLDPADGLWPDSQGRCQGKSQSLLNSFSRPGWVLVAQSAPGTPLRQLLEEDGAWHRLLEGLGADDGCSTDAGPALALLRVAADVAYGLRALHKAGLAHGSVEPGAVFILQIPRTLVPTAGAAAAKTAAAGDGRPHSGNSLPSLRAKLGLPLPTSRLPEQRLCWSAPAWQQARALGHFPAHVAPELLGGGPATAAGDVYAFGALLWSLWAGGFALDGVPSLAYVQEGLRPVFTKCPHSLSQLALRCMAGEASARPSMRQVVQELSAMQEMCTAWPSPCSCLSHGRSGGRGGAGPLGLLQEQQCRQAGDHGGQSADPQVAEKGAEEEEEDLLDALAVHRCFDALDAGPSVSCSQHSVWPPFEGSMTPSTWPYGHPLDMGPAPGNEIPQAPVHGEVEGHGKGLSLPGLLPKENTPNCAEQAGLTSMSWGGSMSTYPCPAARSMAGPSIRQLRMGRSVPGPVAAPREARSHALVMRMYHAGMEHQPAGAAPAWQPHSTGGRRLSRLSLCSHASGSVSGGVPVGTSPDATWCMAAAAAAGNTNAGSSSTSGAGYSNHGSSGWGLPGAHSGGSSSTGGLPEGLLYSMNGARRRGARSSSSTVQLMRLLLRAQAARQQPVHAASDRRPGLDDFLMAIDLNSNPELDTGMSELRG